MNTTALPQLPEPETLIQLPPEQVVNIIVQQQQIIEQQQQAIELLTLIG